MSKRRDLAGSAPPQVQVPPKKKTSPILLGCLVLFLIFIGLGIVGSIVDPTPASSRAGASAAAASEQITMANFNRLHEGMAYEDVVKILGGPGEVQSSSDLAGYKAVMYAWKAKYGFGNMNAMFQNGRLVSKAQFGLR